MGPKSRSGGVGSSGVGLSQTSPIPRSPDGDNKNTALFLPGQINDKRIKKKKKLFAICLDKKEMNKHKQRRTRGRKGKDLCSLPEQIEYLVNKKINSLSRQIKMVK